MIVNKMSLIFIVNNFLRLAEDHCSILILMHMNPKEI
jgi:hypothetical protein